MARISPLSISRVDHQLLNMNRTYTICLFPILSLGLAMPLFKSQTLFSFNHATSESWYVINDGVMGGLSQSQFEIAGGLGVFTGNVSLENYGGFASVRGELPSVSPVGFNSLRIRIKGDGKMYKFRLRTNQRFDGVAYSVNFQTRAGKWQTHLFHQDQFMPVFRGRQVRGAPALEMTAVRQVGFLIGDKQVGPFRLEIDEIQVVSGMSL